ncbi:hypothetical protein VW29_09705 [Devosia limi DSM 17137]|uniref:Thioredoxin domain-containing protein n=1 Tax=Devosia limi DSM 17137 TaxID=1121477 RepID=A0A0F5LQV9_9HYPH|nr:hypothetical protein VW29_09705 [Devosia limi DSM 17137]
MLSPDADSNPASVRPAQSLSNLTFTDAQGKSASLTDFRDKTVLLNVWATWCAPCREEMPALDRLQLAMGGDKFEVVTLSIDRTGNEVVRPFFEEIGVKNLDVYLDPTMSTMATAGILGLPTTLLIDTDGTEVYRWVGPVEWDLPQTINALNLYLESGNTAQLQLPRAN